MLMVYYGRLVELPNIHECPFVVPNAVNDNGGGTMEALANACAFSLLATMTNVHTALREAFLRGVSAARDSTIIKKDQSND